MPQTNCINPRCEGKRTWNLSIRSFSPCDKCGEPKPKQPEDPIEKNMERKETFISKSIEKKNTAIEISGSRRDAVLIVTALMRNEAYLEAVVKDRSKLESELEYWARYIINLDPSQEEPKEDPTDKLIINKTVNELF